MILINYKGKVLNLSAAIELRDTSESQHMVAFFSEDKVAIIKDFNIEALKERLSGIFGSMNIFNREWYWI